MTELQPWNGEMYISKKTNWLIISQTPFACQKTSWMFYDGAYLTDWSSNLVWSDLNRTAPFSSPILGTIVTWKKHFLVIKLKFCCTSWTWICSLEVLNSFVQNWALKISSQKLKNFQLTLVDSFLIEHTLLLNERILQRRKCKDSWKGLKTSWICFRSGQFAAMVAMDASLRASLRNRCSLRGLGSGCPPSSNCAASSKSSVVICSYMTQIWFSAWATSFV